MKTISLFILAITTTLFISGQELNQEITLENGKKFLIGEITKEGLTQTTYNGWYQPNYDRYTVNQPVIEQFKDTLKHYQILVFLGTWCGDSKREVPRLMKILDAAEHPSKNLKIVALDSRKDHYKKSPDGEEWGLQILRVPTFIFYRNGREQNRIIETPNRSLEEDMLQIVTSDNYIANKAKSMHFD
jgi:thiol-disulfide isomerase/thioredoxin